MATGERSISDVLQDIIGNIQDILRSEIRLAKTEIREQADKAKLAGILIGSGAVAGVFAAFLILLTFVYALTRVIPDWAAALVVALGLLVLGSALIASGIGRFKKVKVAPDKTIENMKENIEWAKQETK